VRGPNIPVLLVALAATCGAQTPPSQPRLWSICELFEDLVSHAGRVVTVRGLLEGRLALGGRCQSKFVTRYLAFPGLPGVTPDLTAEYVWPTAIKLT